MKVEVNRKEFYDGIQQVKQAVSSKTSMPILSGILLATEENRLKLVGTDLEIGIESFVDVTVQESGAIVLPAQTLTRIVRELPNEQITLTTDDSTNTAQINCGHSKFNIHGSEADEFPTLPDLEDGIEFEVEQELFTNLIKQTEFAVSQDESKPFLTGGLLELNGSSVNLVATDTYRLAYRGEIIEGVDLEPEEVIIPDQTLSNIKKLAEPDDEETIEVLITDNQALFTFSGLTMVSRLIEGEFPDYQQVIPDNNQTEVVADTKELLSSLKRAALVAREDSDTVKFDLRADKLIITSNAPEVGQAYEELTVEAKGDEIEFAFNANYMIDCLKAISAEQVTLHFADALSPGIVKPKSETEYVYVVMPVRSS